MALSLSFRKKLIAVLISTSLFVVLAAPLIIIFELTFGQAIVGALVLGALVSSFEEFYVRGTHGRWLRAMHPLKSLLVYGMILVCIFLIMLPINHALFGRLDRLPEAYARLPIVLPLTLLLAIAAVTAMRIVGFLGARNLFYLTIGKYHRPAVKRMIVMFLDIKSSTGLVERLGPVMGREIIGKFFFDISKPITDHGGDIYRFTGDGLVATWDWESGVVDNMIVRAVDEIGQAIALESHVYKDKFDHVPEFRIGVHGGEIVICEEGDTKRAIGYYGETIHIAARLEQKAKEVGVDFVFSEVVTERLTGIEDRLELIQREPVRGISKSIGLYALKAEDASRSKLVDSTN